MWVWTQVPLGEPPPHQLGSPSPGAWQTEPEGEGGEGGAVA